MRIAAVGADGADGRVIAGQLVLLEMIEDHLLHLGLADGLAGPDAVGDEAKRDVVG
jgi:hypothetical protein